MLRAWASDLADFVMPLHCAGCAARGQALCPTCAALFRAPVWRAEAGAARLCPADGGPPLPVWSVAQYTGSVREAITAWKRAGRAELTRPFAEAMARIGQHLAPLAAPWSPDLALVPIPSRATSRLKRGGLLTLDLASGLAQGMDDAGVPTPVRQLLARAPGSRDQVGLGSRARATNRVDSTTIRRGGGPLPAAVILTDDIVTTGASLLDAERVLTRAGVLVLGAAILAATPPNPGAGVRGL
ncbi:MAG: ComF family protein [Micrococcales bacterium]|nr:ComF family protein [Micrococcales bacterium]